MNLIPEFNYVLAKALIKAEGDSKYAIKNRQEGERPNVNPFRVNCWGFIDRDYC